MAFFNNRGAVLKLNLTPETQAKVDEYKEIIKEIKGRLALLSIMPLDPQNKKAVNSLVKTTNKLANKLDRAVISAHVDNMLENANHLKNVSFNRDVYSLEECGYVLGGITRERIRQIESSAIKKLKHPKIGREMKNYLDLGDDGIL